MSNLPKMLTRVAAQSKQSNMNPRAIPCPAPPPLPLPGIFPLITASSRPPAPLNHPTTNTVPSLGTTQGAKLAPWGKAGGGVLGALADRSKPPLHPSGRVPSHLWAVPMPRTPML